LLRLRFRLHPAEDPGADEAQEPDHDVDRRVGAGTRALEELRILQREHEREADADRREEPADEERRQDLNGMGRPQGDDDDRDQERPEDRQDRECEILAGRHGLGLDQAVGGRASSRSDEVARRPLGFDEAMSRRVIAFLVLIAAVVVVFLAYEAFGKDSDDSSSSASSADVWMSKFCSTVTGWKTDLQSAAKQATDNPTKEGIQSAVDSASTSTKETASSLRDLGLPTTDGSEEATNTLKQLQEQLRS